MKVESLDPVKLKYIYLRRTTYPSKASWLHVVAKVIICNLIALFCFVLCISDHCSKFISLIMFILLKKV